MSPYFLTWLCNGLNTSFRDEYRHSHAFEYLQVYTSVIYFIQSKDGGFMDCHPSL